MSKCFSKEKIKETNLKLRCEAPNNAIYKFEGTLEFNE
jgi:hypothetical protein